ncbi:hypothetical protein [Chitinimonas sp. BJB300]|uniref:hypothetical protein n=1 Tax=Chitinimonas sp. BJB300 TaxID=1559339 RepID=UPI000C10BA01|nr:hypothetical protein [Chitinimonas sp. BJB300]PHV10067.1 hypothetical protein CSQ89_18220 [Chitinimonas sp. BJB300]TSJ83733.1 hypothetical protein FG002_021090 [Chitinimonas sp. BJB300]TSJ83739.1 hypothetical protein FG002_021125 [Chitinimonas sp. BJB300]TSJ84633.1 hypothetical protein FG002_019125 [Chitinimonas sp. BJB300]TSJ84664.1 hypothetical protein FG002_019290 [Chitinimonas sp. BJB300]
MTKVFIIPFHVRRLDISIMPAGFSGGYVSCYSPGNDYVEATKKALGKLAEDGLNPEEILQPIHEIDTKNWSRHISEQWPDQADSLLDQDEFEKEMASGHVVYGPFGSYT